MKAARIPVRRSTEERPIRMQHPESHSEVTARPDNSNERVEPIELQEMKTFRRAFPDPQPYSPLND
jgi:hypothetical protein